MDTLQLIENSPYTVIFHPENVGTEDAESKYIEYEHAIIIK